MTNLGCPTPAAFCRRNAVAALGLVIHLLLVIRHQSVAWLCVWRRAWFLAWHRALPRIVRVLVVVVGVAFDRARSRGKWRYDDFVGLCVSV